MSDKHDYNKNEILNKVCRSTKWHGTEEKTVHKDIKARKPEKEYDTLYQEFISYFWLYWHVNNFELPHDKTNKMACGPSEDSAAWASAQSGQSLRWVING